MSTHTRTPASPPRLATMFPPGSRSSRGQSRRTTRRARDQAPGLLRGARGRRSPRRRLGRRAQPDRPGHLPPTTASNGQRRPVSTGRLTLPLVKGGQALVAWVATIPEARGQGAGGLVMRFLLEAADHAGAREVALARSSPRRTSTDGSVFPGRPALRRARYPPPPHDPV